MELFQSKVTCWVVLKPEAGTKNQLWFLVPVPSLCRSTPLHYVLMQTALCPLNFSFLLLVHSRIAVTSWVASYPNSKDERFYIIFYLSTLRIQVCHESEWELQRKFFRETMPLSHKVQKGPPFLSKLLIEGSGCTWIPS